MTSYPRPSKVRPLPGARPACASGRVQACSVLRKYVRDPLSLCPLLRAYAAGRHGRAYLFSSV